MRLGGVLAVVPAVVLLLAGCGAAGAQSTYTPTVTVAPSTASSPADTARVTRPATPVGTPTPLGSATTATTATTAADPNRPAGQCADADLKITLTASDGDVGSEYRDIVFTNTGADSCVLRGTPGVSVVGDGNGTQLGVPATRGRGGAMVRIQPGAAPRARLQIVNIGDDGGPLDNCTVVHGDGYRIYAPHSTAAVFVRDAKAVACSGKQSFMNVEPVTKG